MPSYSRSKAHLYYNIFYYTRLIIYTITSNLKACFNLYDPTLLGARVQQSTIYGLKLGPGSVLGFSEGLLRQASARTVVSSTRATLWVVPIATLQALSAQVGGCKHWGLGLPSGGLALL